MSQSALFWPVLIQVLLTLIVLLIMGPARSGSMKAAGQKLTDADVRLGRNSWDERSTKIANSYRNQFELPVLFYVAVAMALALRLSDVWFLSLAWVFALSRVVHAIIHIGPNVIVWRGTAFIVGVATLLAMWTRLAAGILAGS